MRTKIFAYKGVIGADTDIDNGKFLNNPKEDGELGVVVPVEEIDITQEAVNLLKSTEREAGSFAPIMLTKHQGIADDGSIASIGLLGFWKHIFANDDLRIGRDCDTSILELCNITDIEIPEKFIEIVDKNK